MEFDVKRVILATIGAALNSVDLFYIIRALF